MDRTFQLLIITIIIFGQSCNNNQNKVVINNSDSIKIISLTHKWNECLANQYTQNLAELYADQVLLYGISISKKQAISNKESYFKKHPDFKQSISEDLKITKVTDLQYKVRFKKHSIYSNKTSTVEAYLIFDNLNDNWKITNESDELTDRNITKFDTKEKKELRSCIDIVLEILTTSPLYLINTKGLYEAVVNNGGISFGITIEGSPNPESDEAMVFSNTYDFSLHETYSDHMPVIARFTFNPTNRQLYEYDFAEGILKPIEFDKNLLSKFNKICK